MARHWVMARVELGVTWLDRQQQGCLGAAIRLPSPHGWVHGVSSQVTPSSTRFTLNDAPFEPAPLIDGGNLSASRHLCKMALRFCPATCRAPDISA